MVKSESPLNVDEARKKLEELSPERRALLAQLLRKKAMEQEGGMRRMEPGLPEIVPDPAGRYAPFPLTELQQAYWFGRTSAFEMGAVVSCAYVEVERAGLDLHRFEQAWERLTARHDMLRAVVLPDGRQQVLETVPPYRVEVLDLRGLPADAAEARLKEISQAILDDLRPADEWPLYDIRAARLDGDRTRLHFRFDLLVFDAASITKLFRELTILYDNPAAELKPLEITYRDYVLAARKILDSPLYKKSREYWMNRLATLPPRPGPAVGEKPRGGGKAPVFPAARPGGCRYLEPFEEARGPGGCNAHGSIADHFCRRAGHLEQKPPPDRQYSLIQPAELASPNQRHRGVFRYAPAAGFRSRPG